MCFDFLQILLCVYPALRPALRKTSGPTFGPCPSYSAFCRKESGGKGQRWHARMRPTPFTSQMVVIACCRLSRPSPRRGPPEGPKCRGIVVHASEQDPLLIRFGGVKFAMWGFRCLSTAELYHLHRPLQICPCFCPKLGDDMASVATGEDGLAWEVATAHSGNCAIQWGWGDANLKKLHNYI